MSLVRSAPAVLAALLVTTAATTGCASDAATGPRLPPPVASVTVSPNTATVAVGATTSLSALLFDASQATLTGRAITWTSSDDTRATVNGSGVVTGVAEGTVTISAASEGKQGSATVTVTAPGTGPVVTDSVLAVAISSYLGGSAFDHARDVAVDAAGNIYIVGGTMSPNFPTTPGAFQRIHNPGTPSPGVNPMDAFVVKLSPGGQLIWSTLLGGPEYDRAYAVEVDAQGNVYVAGRAGAGFPVTPGAFQTTFYGGQEATFYGNQDGFVCKLDASGSSRIYCSYFGTSDPQIVRDIAIDAQGNAYLAASAKQDLPTGWFTNAAQKTRAGGIDGVIAKINATGSQVLWATYVGGSADEGGETSVRVDGNGYIYFLVNTHSSGLPTPGGFDHTLGGSGDVYLAKLAPAGNSLLYATYLGGSGIEFTETHGLAVDPAGNAVVALTTASADFPTTPGAYQRAYGGAGGSGTGSGTNYPADAAIVKVGPTGALLAATYLGGQNGEGAEGIDVDGRGNVYVSGGTFSANFPTTAGTYRNGGGSLDAFITEFDPNLGTLIFSEKFGGSGSDVARATDVDPAGNVCSVGEASSANMPVAGGFQAGFGGVTDALFVRLVRAP